jgi:Tol biopolymer transport system component
MRAVGKRIGLVGLAFAIAAGMPAGARAQYFGTNKVRYGEPEFQMLASPHFDVYFYAEEEAVARLATRMAERWYARYSRLLDHELSQRQPILLYASHADFEQTNAISGVPSEGTGGVTEFLKRRIVLPLAGSLAESDHVLGHEIAHAFQIDLLAHGRSRDASSGASLPGWLIEGGAEYLSLGPMASQTQMWLRDALVRDDLPDARAIESGRYFPYRYGHAFWTFLAFERGDRVVGELLRKVAGGASSRAALEAVLGRPLDQISADWRAFAERHAGPVAGAVALAPLGGTLGAAELQLGPALSPDGRLVSVYVARRAGLELVIAEVESGRILHRVVRAGLDPHFESLSFVRSSGSWSPDGRRLAFSMRSEGRAVLALFDTATGGVEREIALDEVDEVTAPAWSPDGDRIAFSGLRGGVTDLFVYHLSSGRLEALTDDAFAELDPEWFPDGERLVFVSDRDTLDLARCAGARYELAWLDPVSRARGRVASLPGANHGSLQFGPDGSLFFVSDLAGVPDVYRLELDSGGAPSVHRVTRAATGIAGLAPDSPALAVARDVPILVASVFEKQGSRLQALRGAEALHGAPLSPADVAPPLVALPAPSAEDLEVTRRGELARLLADRDLGWGEEELAAVPYAPRLALDSVGPPTLIAGASRTSSFVAGGTSLLWSDMLGDHLVGAGLQVNGELADFAGVLAYENRQSRFDWGVALEQVPYVTGSYAAGAVDAGGDVLFVEESIRLRELHRQLGGVIAYPFDRSLRAELIGSLRRITFDADSDVEAYSLTTGEEISVGELDLATPSDLSLAQLGMALVYDATLYGPTSPVEGMRWRLETSGVRGSLDYQEVLADGRRYFALFEPLTLALRLLHVGRYGGDAESEQLSPLFVGYTNLVRGYERASFDVDECEGDAECPAFSQLLGSRMLVANAELRFPVFGMKRSTRLPLEAALFADAGWAWDSDVSPSFAGGERDPVRSVGAALRLNVAGFAVLELAAARPLDRPERDVRFLFSLRSGL